MTKVDCYTFKFSSASKYLHFILAFILIWLACLLFIGGNYFPSYILFAVGLIFIIDTLFSRDDYIRLDHKGIEINQCNELSVTRIKAHYAWSEIEHLQVVPATLKKSFNLELYGKGNRLLGKYSVAEKQCVEVKGLSIEQAYQLIKNQGNIY